MASASARPSPAPSSERLESSRPKRRRASPRTLGRDAGPAVGDLDPDLLLVRLHADPDLAARRAVADRILDQVADRLGEQLAMAEERDRRGRAVIFERGAPLPRRAARTFRSSSAASSPSVEPG